MKEKNQTSDRVDKSRGYADIREQQNRNRKKGRGHEKDKGQGKSKQMCTHFPTWSKKFLTQSYRGFYTSCRRSPNGKKRKTEIKKQDRKNVGVRGKRSQRGWKAQRTSASSSRDRLTPPETVIVV